MTEFDESPDVKNSSFTAALVEDSPDALIALSADGKVLFWNQGASSIFGFTREEALGQSLDDLMIPDDRQAEAHEALRQALEGKTPLFETVRRRKDGTWV